MSDKSNRTVYVSRGIADVLKHSTELRPKETSYKTRGSNKPENTKLTFPHTSTM